MSATLFVLVLLLVVPVVGLLSFAGCGSFAAEPGMPEPDPGPGTVIIVPPTPKRSYRDRITGPGGEGLVAYWTLAEPGATTAFDSGPSGLHGTYAGTPAPELGVAGGALTPRVPNDGCVRFEGTADQGGYVTVPYSAKLNPGPGLRFSFETWARLRNPGADVGETQVLASLRSFLPGFVSTGWELYVTIGSTGLPTFGARVFAGSGADDAHAEILVDSPNAGADAWHHCVLVYDGPAKTIAITVRRVGEANAFTKDAPVTTYRASADTNSPFLIGAGNAPLPASFFNGDLDEVAFYNTALTGPQIKEHFEFATVP